MKKKAGRKKLLVLALSIAMIAATVNLPAFATVDTEVTETEPAQQTESSQQTEAQSAEPPQTLLTEEAQEAESSPQEAQQTDETQTGETQTGGEDTAESQSADHGAALQNDTEELNSEDASGQQEAEAENEVKYSTDGGATWQTASFNDALYNCWSYDNSQIELYKDIVLSDGYGITAAYNDKNLTIDGKGYKITRAGNTTQFFSVNASGSTVTLKNITLDGGAVWNGSDPANRTNSGLSYNSNKHLILVDEGGELILGKGVVLQNSDIGNSYGAAVSVMNNSTLIMKEGAEIRYNTAQTGGAIYVDFGSVFQMEGGKIYGNYASSGGGAVNVGGYTGGVFNMSGGEIYENASSNNSGGVCINANGQFTMSGGKIYKNKSTAGGGGVTTLAGTSVFTMTGGEITGNSITGTLGGGVLINGGAFNISGNGVIKNNTQNGTNASNVYLQSGKVINISAALNNGTFIGVTTKTEPTDVLPTNITGANAADYSGYFSSDNPAYSVVNTNNVVQLINKTTTVPSEPQNLQVTTPPYQQAVLSWEAPADNGGSAVSGYEVSSDGGNTWVAAGSDTGHTFTGLEGNVEHTFQVRAINSAGNGAAAEKKATPIPLPTYEIVLIQGTGYTAQAVNGSASPVTRGDPYSFTVTIADGYEKGADFAVKANGTELTADANGVYTISNITEKQTVTVEGVKEITRSGETETKIEINENFTDADIPQELKNAGYDTVAKIDSRLKTVLTQLNSNIEETALYDVILMYSEDGGKTWIKADETHFPKSGKLLVSLPVPEGTDINTHDYIVSHMFTSSAFGKVPGNTEQPEVTEKTGNDGKQYIDFYVTGLSPVMVAWENTVKDGSAGTGDDSDMLPWVIAAATAVMVGAGTALVRRRRTEK